MEASALARAWRLLGFVTQAQPAPVPAADHDRHRKIVHQLTGIPGIGLQKQRLLVAATADPVRSANLRLLRLCRLSTSGSPVSGWEKTLLWVGT